jgi:hypothetical protein
MPQVERPGTNLKQERSHEQEVVSAYEHDFDVGPTLKELLQVLGCVGATESAAQDQDPSFRGWRGSVAVCPIAVCMICRIHVGNSHWKRDGLSAFRVALVACPPVSEARL